MTSQDRRLRDSLDLTITAVLETAMARYAFDRMDLRAFEFCLLAAAEADRPKLPTQAVFDSGYQLSMSFAHLTGRIEVHLQAVGFTALNALAGKSAWLVSDDIGINRRFGFDTKGSACVVLDDSDPIRAALARVSVILPDAEGV